MRRSSLRTQRTDQRGFTILELVLVLSVLVVLAALGWPSFVRYMAETRLRDSVKELRKIAASTRALAIESGLVYQFRYEPGGRRYIVVPLEKPTPEDLQGTAPAQASQLGQPAAVKKTVRSLFGQLDESCQFLVTTSLAAKLGVPEAPAVERIPQDVLALLEGDGGGLSDVQWSSAIRFFPDGTADDRSINVATKTKLAMNVSVRGLTGVVYVGEVTREP